jgi:hypothetical protein
VYLYEIEMKRGSDLKMCGFDDLQMVEK